MSGNSGRFTIPPKGTNPIVKWPIIFTYPNETGTVSKYRLMATFEVLSESDIEKVMQPEEADTPTGDTSADDAGLALIKQAIARKGSDRLLMKRVLKKLEGFDVEGEPEPEFTDEVFDYFWGQMAIRSALVTSYFACIAGRVEKN